MRRDDAFKSLYLAMVVAMVGLKWLFVGLFLLRHVPAPDVRVLAEIHILVPTAALLLGAAQVARVGTLRPRHGLRVLATLAGVFLLGCAMAVADALGLAALLDPRTAVAILSPREIVILAALTLVQTVSAWLFGAWIVGTLFWRRPGIDDTSSP